jgi:hypothetical protein
MIRAMLARIETMHIASATKDAADDVHLNVQDAGRRDGLWQRRDEPKTAAAPRHGEQPRLRA